MYQRRVDAISKQGGWRLAGLPIIVSLVVLALIPSVVTPLAAVITGEAWEANPITIASTLGMISAVVLGGLLMIYASKISWESLGFVREQRGRSMLLGVGLGAGLLALVALLTWLFGGVDYSYAFTLNGLGAICLAIVFFAFQGTWEELVYRGYLMPHFSKYWGDRTSIVVTSIAFAAFHALNPGLTVMPIINLVLFGFVFALLYYRTGNMWITGLAHSAWNFSQGYLFGSEVSGNAIVASVFDATPIAGRELISGAEFGFEGSIITSIFGVVIIAALTIWWPKFSRMRRTDPA
ncbi:CPBP family intramembrane glutamic endopeptidase [Corynebacterium sp.]|uniref:CPBP family intramembrane glutamic endopeptidase n=1 Tax=Corynebacterium sp. TaxID=1720 RepID=UPI0026DB05F4|nr:type II CAAX endopeptidase family protein [Corynebacterium sp.]MDO5077238.1 type II CAAX endopeptidase family protein [Corynebacterium sp.]